MPSRLILAAPAALLTILWALLWALPPAGSPAPARAAEAAFTAPLAACRVLRTMPHDPDAFTQGLLPYNGLLLESVGGYGVSEARITDPETGRVLRSAALPANRFGEGLALVPGPRGERLVQITWRSGEARFLDPQSLEILGTARYDGEGWGLTTDSRGNLLMSDGGSRLTRRDAGDFSVLGRIQVMDGDRPVRRLNELEWAEGLDPAGPVVLANVLGLDRIAAIDPDSGRVRFWIDCAGLHPAGERRSPQNVLNGIAWDRERRRLLVTGKRWPKMFEIEVVFSPDQVSLSPGRIPPNRG